MDKTVEEKMKKAYNELIILYEQNKREELAAIRDSNLESDMRKIMANELLQLGPDPRRKLQ